MLYLSTMKNRNNGHLQEIYVNIDMHIKLRLG